MSDGALRWKMKKHIDSSCCGAVGRFGADCVTCRKVQGFTVKGWMDELKVKI